MYLSKKICPSLSTGSTQEDPSDMTEKNLEWDVNKKTHVTWISHLNPCQKEKMFTTKYKSHSPILESILGVLQHKEGQDERGESFIGIFL